MDVGHQHVGSSPEDLSGAVARVDVPVDDHDPLDAQLGERELGRDRNVVEQAESHCAVPTGVMTGGAQRAEPGELAV